MSTPAPANPSPSWTEIIARLALGLAVMLLGFGYAFSGCADAGQVRTWGWLALSVFLVLFGVHQRRRATVSTKGGQS